MQKLVLVLLFVVAGSVSSQAQSLKELLYGGKLRMDSNAVLRKTDDLKARIDTAQKKPAEPVVASTTTPTAAPTDSVKRTAPVADSQAVAAEAGEPVTVDTVAAASAEVNTVAAPPKSNNQILKAYTDSLVTTLKAEVLSSKKIKKETYYITVGYEIDTNGQVTITNITTTPENALLQAQVKQRMEVYPPQLTPTLDSAGKPRKTKRNYNFSVTKD
jgi:hypothetical protein